MVSWSVSGAVAAGDINVTAQLTVGTGIRLSPDGKRMFLSSNSPDSVFEYYLSTPWDITNFSFSVSLSIANETALQGMSFRPDGAKMYAIGNASDRFRVYNLINSWSLTGAGFSGAFLQSQDGTPVDCLHNSDGTKAFVHGLANDRIYQYSETNSGAWGGGLVYDNESFYYGAQAASAEGSTWGKQGKKFYISDTTNSKVHQYSAVTAYTLSGMVYDNESFKFPNSVGDNAGFEWKIDGTRFYRTSGSGSVYQFDVSNDAPASGAKIQVGDKWFSAAVVLINVGNLWNPIVDMKLQQGDAWKATEMI